MSNLLRIAGKGRVFFPRLILLAIILFSGISSAYPQTPLSLNPAAAADMAIKNNLMMEMARIGTDMKKRKSDLVWNEFLPSLSVNGTLGRYNWATTTQGIEVISSSPYLKLNSITLPDWFLTGGFSAELIFSFALIDGIKSIKQDYYASRITFEKAKLQMEQGVRKMYNAILLLEANVVLLKDSFENYKRQADIAEANFRAGLVPRLAWLQAQVAVENMKPAINDLENTLKTLRGNFALLLGLPFDAAFELEPVSLGIEFIPSDVGDFISRSATGKPDIQELQANLVTLYSQRKALTTQGYTPYLRFGWSLSSMFNPVLDPFKNNWFNGDNWNSKGQAGGTFSITVGMSINSLFPFTKEGQLRKDVEAGLQIQNIALAQMIRETELEIFTIINSLEKNRAGAVAQQATVDLAEQSYRLTEEAYRAGLQDFQSVQNAALAYDQAKIQLLTQQFNYLNDLISLEYSIGVPFGTLSSSGTKQ